MINVENSEKKLYRELQGKSDKISCIGILRKYSSQKIYKNFLKNC